MTSSVCELPCIPIINNNFLTIHARDAITFLFFLYMEYITKLSALDDVIKSLYQLPVSALTCKGLENITCILTIRKKYNKLKISAFFGPSEN